jgi:hypothetical protein
VLYDFFYKDDRYDDDILASDFLGKDSKEWELFIKERTPKDEFQEIIKKCNKQLAHLTYARVREYVGSNKGWDSEKISRMMENTINAFVNTLPDKYKKYFSILVTLKDPN